MRLYGYWRSSATYRIRIALALKGIAYELTPVHLLQGGGEQHQASFAAMNPMEQVPVLEVTPGVRLAQSVAIMEYLEETHPEPHLLPADPLLRARTRQLTEVVNSGIQPLQNLLVTQRLKELGVDEKGWVAHFVERGLTAYEAIASTTAGRYSVGDSPTFADCALIPQVYAARRFGVNVAAFPTIARIDALCATEPTFAAAHPDRQPDAHR